MDADVERYQHLYTAKLITEWNQSPEDLLLDVNPNKRKGMLDWVTACFSEILGLRESSNIGVKIIPLIVTFMFLVSVLSWILRTYCKRCRKSERPSFNMRNP